MLKDYLPQVVLMLAGGALDEVTPLQKLGSCNVSESTWLMALS